jgi:hypothetical protein
MSKMKNCTVGDIAAFAEDYGYAYNQVINMMSNDRFIPFYEQSFKEIHKGYGEDYGFSQELSAIIDKFVEEKGECAVTE